jgi:hypothetical protein
MLPEILDTFPSFLEYWENVKCLGLQEQIEAWHSQYMALWPDLLQKQIEDYSEQIVDWREIAAERVFPFIPERLSLMDSSRSILLRSLILSFSKTSSALGFKFPVIFVIYVGIGCGAGWATRLRGKPAVLFGLENIVECGWTGKEAIQGLIAHEIGHLVHWHWRDQAGLENGSGPWWQLYEEGFAQRCECLVQGTWHQALSDECDDWLEWCRENRASLAAEFLARADRKADVRDFFGSWFDIGGRAQTGYFLGYEIICELEGEMRLEEVARLENIEGVCRTILKKMANLDA